MDPVWVLTSLGRAVPAPCRSLCLNTPGEYGFDVEEVKALPDLQFVGRNLDSGGELRGRIKVWSSPRRSIAARGQTLRLD